MAGIKDIIEKILNGIKNLKTGQKIRLIIFTVIAIAIIVASSIILNKTTYTVLYSNMDPEDAGEVMAKLQEMQVPAKAQGSDTILVESSQADSVRMQLASEGYPSSGLNYDIFQNASGLGTTEMEKKVYLQFQLAENLRQTIKQLDKVEDAVVNINLSQDSQFVLSSNNKPASAAVVLKLKDEAELGTKEVRAIAELVSKSIAGLKLDDVRIIDTKMNLYDISEDSAIETLGTQLSLQQNVQDRLQEQVVNLLTPVFGEGGVLAQVNLVLNFDREIKESIEFTPPVEGSSEGIVVSMQELAETVQGDSTGGVVGAGSNTGTTTYPALTDENSVYNRVSREANYELNETKTQIEKAQGKIEQLSVSVILNTASLGTDYTENVKNLVASAIGVSNELVTVEMLPFAQENHTESQDLSYVFNNQEKLLNTVNQAKLIRIAIITGASVVVLLILFSMAKSIAKTQPTRPAQAASGSAGVEYLADEEIELPKQGPKFQPIEIKEDTDLNHLEQFIEKSPESVAQLLRNWLSDEKGR